MSGPIPTGSKAAACAAALYEWVAAADAPECERELASALRTAALLRVATDLRGRLPLSMLDRVESLATALPAQSDVH